MDIKESWEKYCKIDLFPLLEKTAQTFLEYVMNNEDELINQFIEKLEMIIDKIALCKNDLNSIEFSMIKSKVGKKGLPFLVEALSYDRNVLAQQEFLVGNIDLITLNQEMHVRAKKYVLKIPIVSIEKTFLEELGGYQNIIQKIAQKSVNQFMQYDSVKSLIDTDFIITYGDYRQEQEVLFNYEAY